MSETAALQTQTPKAPPSNSHSLLVQRKCACGGSSGLTGSCSGCEKKKMLGKPLQTKLRINEPGDEYEQEADRIANQVIAAATHHTANGSAPRIQRFAGQSNGSMETALASVDQALATPGTPLEPALRQEMEQHFGYDFSKVRLHTGAAAEHSADDLNASAYTIGHHVMFTASRFAPATYEGRRLIAHELTHVVQQFSGRPSNVISHNRVARSSVRPQLFRQTREKAHYPSEDEQREIEKALAREYKTTQVVESASGELIEKKGRSLTIPQIRELAAALEAPFAAALNELDDGISGKGDAISEAAAFEAVQRARQAIVDRFGKYTTHTPTLTLDRNIPDEVRKKGSQVLVIFGDPDAASALARTIVVTHCKQCKSALADVDDTSKRIVTDLLVTAAFRKHREKLQRVAERRVPGKHGAAGRITLRLTEEKAFYGTAVHELVHEFAHPAFHAAFLDERNIVEGFTEYFTRQIVNDERGSYEEMYQKVVAVRGAIKGPFIFSSTGGSAEESLRLAYFGGRLDLIGWKPSGPDEQRAVEKAGGSAPWDPNLARTRTAEYRAEAQAAQRARKNVLGVGLLFTQKGDRSIDVRFARVLTRSEPYAKRQLLLEGQLMGSPIRKPETLGASLGVAVEYQEPHFFAGAGVRFVGTTGLADGSNRLDVSPFVSVGVRWQSIRVGADALVLLPVTGQDTALGAGIGVGIEL